MRARGEEGYTLIELLVVLAILGFIAAIATPVAVRTVEDATLKSDARRLIGDLRRLQHLAVERQTTVIARARSDGNGLSASSGDDFDLSPNETVTLNSATQSVAYYPDGTSSGGGLRVAEGAHALDIEIAWLTGTPTMESEP